MPSGIYKRTEKHIGVWTGKKRPPFSDKWRENIGKANKGRKHKPQQGFQKGEDHPNWQNGKSFEEYGIDWTETLRESIRKRDNYMCYACGIHQDELTGWYKKLDVHHIEYNKNDFNPDKLVALCRSCHIKTNSNREYWTKYFNKIL
jgi:hypothetical protein